MKKPYIPEDCKYAARVEDGNLISAMNGGHIEFCKAIIKDMDNYIKLAVPCKCEICQPKRTLIQAKQELCMTLTIVQEAILKASGENDLTTINNLDKNLKKALLMSIDNYQLKDD